MSPTPIRRGRCKRLLSRLPSPAETAAEIRDLARRLGLLIDLHQVVQQLRKCDHQKPHKQLEGEP